MRTIACIVAAGVAALTAAAGLGCQGSDRPRQITGEPAGAPTAPSAAPAAPSAAAPAAPAAPAPAPPGAATGSAGAPLPPAYADDVAKLCDVVRLSGAESESPGDRRVPIANWLAANLTTAESRQFLARIQPLDGAQKADALDAEARRVGLTGCALAAEWRAPPMQ
jgi:hypothetical protein